MMFQPYQSFISQRCHYQSYVGSCEKACMLMIRWRCRFGDGQGYCQGRHSLHAL